MKRFFGFGEDGVPLEAQRHGLEDVVLSETDIMSYRGLRPVCAVCQLNLDAIFMLEERDILLALLREMEERRGHLWPPRDYLPRIFRQDHPREEESSAMYDPDLVRPMREEVTRLGVKELLTAKDVEDTVKQPGTTLVFVNSVCGCAAGGARPGRRLEIKEPDRLVTPGWRRRRSRRRESSSAPTARARRRSR